MQSRLKTFLTFCLVFIVPLLAISLLSFLSNLKLNENLLRADVEHEVGVTSNGFALLLKGRETELHDLARSSAMRRYVSSEPAPASRSKEGGKLTFSSGDQLPGGNEEVSEVSERLDPLLRHRFFATIAVFSPNKRLLLVAEPPERQGDGDVVLRTTNLLADQIQPDDAVWATGEQWPRCGIVRQATLGKTLRCTTPVFVLGESPGARGALAADLKLDSLIAPIVSRRATTVPGVSQGATPPQSVVVVLDDAGGIVYHTNEAHKHQQVDNSMPYFVEVAKSMTAGEEGTKYYESFDGDQWLAAYGPLGTTKLSVAVARNYSAFTSRTRRFGWLSLIIALLAGTAAAMFLSTVYLKRTQSLDRVAEGVGAIAKGKLDHRIELKSSDDLRPLADNVGLMTKQLREQLAREAETRQFQSFVRLSAILTHDLKNAIEALSLIVSNMERHFDNKEFRADAMKSLTSATENLKGLVARLSTPVTTLSGEHQMPRRVDIVPMLKRVISMTAEPARVNHEIKINLPESLFAVVDVGRLHKVVENLIINALEAMDKEKGTLTVAAGNTGDGKPFFTVTDTGAGMSQRFIEEKLFRPFATTKKRGVGLGLYTCREVVRANGGSIEVDSREGAGTTFRVVLPSVTIDGQN